jgi:hypothetical protein
MQVVNFVKYFIIKFCRYQIQIIHPARRELGNAQERRCIFQKLVHRIQPDGWASAQIRITLNSPGGCLGYVIRSRQILQAESGCTLRSVFQIKHWQKNPVCRISVDTQIFSYYNSE